MKVSKQTKFSKAQPHIYAHACLSPSAEDVGADAEGRKRSGQKQTFFSLKFTENSISVKNKYSSQNHF